MEHGFKWLNSITDRLFNRFTPKGLGAVAVGLILQKMGASDGIIELAMKYEYSFIYEIFDIIKPYKQVIYYTSIAFICLGGFWILKRSHETIQLRALEIEAKASETLALKTRNNIELAKAECELHNLQCQVLPSAEINQQLQNEKANIELTRAIIEKAKLDLELQEIKEKLTKINKN